jgi:hypothetical protein
MNYETIIFEVLELRKYRKNEKLKAEILAFRFLWVGWMFIINSPKFIHHGYGTKRWVAGAVAIDLKYLG